MSKNNIDKSLEKIGQRDSIFPPSWHERQMLSEIHSEGEWAIIDRFYLLRTITSLNDKLTHYKAVVEAAWELLNKVEGHYVNIGPASRGLREVLETLHKADIGEEE